MSESSGPDYWRAWRGGPLTSGYWVDPLPGWQGMLSSDQIAFYNEQVGGMIDPWDSDRLKAASYELTLGATCLVDGRVRHLTPEDPWLEIPYNSIVFVSMEQQLRLPHYIAARFDLAIEFIYQGILLGTGPQVDPGFQGVLSCPLHNISSDAVHIRLGHPFAKMDFAKTSGLRSGDVSLADLSSENDLYAIEASTGFKGEGGHPVKLFNDSKRWREPIFDYVGSKRVSSSVKALEEDIDVSRAEIGEFGDEIRKLRRFGLASAVAIILAVASLLIMLAQLDRSYVDSKIDSVTVPASPPATPASGAAGLRRLNLRVQRLETQVRRLTRGR